MRRILTFDILLMSIFLIFGGSILSAQTNTLLGKPKTKGGGEFPNLGDSTRVICTLEDENGQYCFERAVTFVNLNFINASGNRGGVEQAVFPCDLYVGLSFGGDTIFTSLSEGVEYDYFPAVTSNEVEAFDGYDAHYSATINFGCFDASAVYSSLNLPVFTDSDCESLDGAPVGYVPVSLEVYCKTDAGMVAVDYCEDFDLFSDIIYDSESPISDCSLGGQLVIPVCCESVSIESPEKPLKSDNKNSKLVNISYQDSEVRLNGDQISGSFYQIYNVNGVLQLSGQLDNVEHSEHFIHDINLRNGIYILVLSGEDHQSSHKFVTFR